MVEIRLHHICLLFLLIGHVLGCSTAGSSGATPTQPVDVAAAPASDPNAEPHPLSDQQAVAIVERSADQLRSLARAVAGALDGSEPDCTRIADSARAWVESHREALRQVRGDALKIPEPRRAELMRASVTGDQAIMTTLSALAGCRDHPDMADVTDALESL